MGVIKMLNNKKNTDIPVTVALSESSPVMHGIQIGNTLNIGSRESQQDSFAISDIMNAGLCERKGVFAVVADGMGGLENGGEISSIVTRTMLQYFNEMDFSEHIELDLLNMLYTANDNVNLLMRGQEQGGSTVVAAIIKDGKMYWISVGDSRIYLFRKGAVMQINREHTYAVELDEKAASGLISWEDAANDPQRASLTSYLGNGKPEKIDRNLRPMQLILGDRVILMSDGIFGTLSDEQIRDAQAVEPYKSAEELQAMVLAKQKPNQDNFTAVILEYKGV